VKSFIVSAVVLLLSFNATASLTFSSYNIRNFAKTANSTDMVQLKTIIKGLNADVISVQEIYNSRAFTKFVSKNFTDYKVVLTKCGGGGQQQLGFMYRPSKVKLVNFIEDARIATTDGLVSPYGCASLRPAAVAFFETISEIEYRNAKKFVAIGLHLKAGSRSNSYKKRWFQYRTLLKMIRELRLSGHKEIIALGDFNTTGFDKKNEDFKQFKDMLNKSGTVTASDRIACTSYWSGKTQNDDIEEPSTLDHIVHNGYFLKMLPTKTEVAAHCRKAACQKVYNSALGSSYETVSDHCPLTVTFE